MFLLHLKNFIRKLSIFIWFVGPWCFTWAQGPLPDLNPMAQPTLDGSVVTPDTCARMRIIASRFLDNHFSFSNLDKELSHRTILKYLNSIDPTKIYFLASEVEKFKEVDLDDEFNDNNCKNIDNILKSYQAHAKQLLIDTKKIIDGNLNFNKKETFEIKPQNWPKNEKEKQERLVKKIKYQYMVSLDDIKPENETEIKQRISKYFLRITQKALNSKKEKVLSEFINSFALALDPHSSFMTQEELEAFSVRIGNKLEGIGVQLQEIDGQIFIRKLINGGAAKETGKISENDRIIGIDPLDGSGYKETVDVELGVVTNLLRGKKGSKVRLVLSRERQNQKEITDVVLVRNEIILEEEKVKYFVKNVGDKRIGVIRIPTFYTDLKCSKKIFTICKGVSYDTENALVALEKEGISSIVIDLRDNGGGDFPESIKLASLFIPAGTVVQTKDKNEKVQLQSVVPVRMKYLGPLVLLINKYSASASEIFAGAVQDYGKGLIVGDESTFGKATVQIIQELSGLKYENTEFNGALKVTIDKFYLPSGRTNQKYGVKSDILLPSLPESKLIGEALIDYALEPETILPAQNFKPVDDIKKYLSHVQKLSIQRTQNYKNLNQILNSLNYEPPQRSVVLTKDLKFIRKQRKKDDTFKQKKEEYKNYILEEAVNIASDLSDDILSENSNK